MSIEITNSVENMLACCPSINRAYILKTAWNTCCDGEYLKDKGISCDLWDGDNEQERLNFEINLIRDIIFYDDLWLVDSNFLAIKY